MRHDLRVTVRAAMILLPVVVVAAAGLWAMPSSLTVRVTLITAVLLWSGYGLLGLQAYVLAPLRTAAGLLQGLREGNYSVRARGGEGRDGLGQLLGEVNALADWLQRQRLTEVEANALLITVMAELDAAVPEPLGHISPWWQSRSIGERIGKEAHALHAQSRYELAVIRIQTSCELHIAEAVSRLLADRHPDVDISKLMRRPMTLRDERSRALLHMVTGRQIDQESWWPGYVEHIKRRNAIIHDGVAVTYQDSIRSLEASLALRRWLLQVQGMDLSDIATAVDEGGVRRRQARQTR